MARRRSIIGLAIKDIMAIVPEGGFVSDFVRGVSMLKECQPAFSISK
jgi:hypothetical protein